MCQKSPGQKDKTSSLFWFLVGVVSKQPSYVYKASHAVYLPTECEETCRAKQITPRALTSAKWKGSFTPVPPCPVPLQWESVPDGWRGQAYPLCCPPPHWSRRRWWSGSADVAGLCWEGFLRPLPMVVVRRRSWRQHLAQRHTNKGFRRYTYCVFVELGQGFSKFRQLRANLGTQNLSEGRQRKKIRRETPSASQWWKKTLHRGPLGVRSSDV